jgi:hypothetical protein
MLNGIKLLLNGGTDEMNSATIPVQWFFSDEVLTQKPGCILLIEQNEREYSNTPERYNGGRRYLCDIGEAVKFIQLYQPGTHKLSALAFLKRSEGVESLLKYENQNGLITYSYPIEFKSNEVEINIRGYESPPILAATVVDFDVPEELFAAKPQTRFSKAVWWWVNLWHEKEPIDQCDYRRRMILAFSFKIPAFLIGAVVMYLISGTFYSLYILIASLLCLFFGYRTAPILEGMWHAFSFTGYKPYRVIQKNDKDCYACRKKCWRYDKFACDHKYMPVTTAEITLTILAGYLIYALGIKSLNIPVLIASISWLVIYTSILLRRFTHLKLRIHFPSSSDPGLWIDNWIKKKQGQKKQKQEESLTDFLAQFSLNHVPANGAVNLKKLPTPLTAEKKIVQKFRVSYWALKAEICKPFSK